MADIRITIRDGIDPKIAPKIRTIGRESLSTAKNVKQLEKSLMGLGKANVANLSKLASELTKVSSGLGKVVASQRKANTVTAKAASNMNKLATATKKAASAQRTYASSSGRVGNQLGRQTSATGRATRATAKFTRVQVRSNAATVASVGGLARNVRNLSLLAGVAFSATSIIEAADSYTVLGNKLETVSKNQAGMNALMEAQFEIANRVRVPVKDVTTSFIRFDLAMSQLGKTQADTLAVTETINKALIVSGATSSESAAALLQLSQAFNKGKLDGDEFRSVMELMPVAADAIAKELGVTRGELLKLAPEGKITAEVLTNAFLKAGAAIDAKFSKTIPTIGQSLTVLGNRLTQAFGRFDKANGITKSIAKTIIALSNNIETTVKVLTVMTVGVAAYTLAVGGASAATAVWNAVLLANPVGLVAASVAAATAAVYFFGDQIKLTEDGMVTLKDVATATWEIIKLATMDASENVGYLWDATVMSIKQAFGGLSTFIGKIISGIWKFWKTYVDLIIGSFVGGVKLIENAWTTFPAFMGKFFIDVANKGVDAAQMVIDAFFNMRQAIIEHITDVVPIIGDYFQSLAGFDSFKVPKFEVAPEVSALAADFDPKGSFSRGFNSQQGTVDGLLGDTLNLLAPAFDSIADEAHNVIKGFRDVTEAHAHARIAADQGVELDRRLREKKGKLELEAARKAAVKSLTDSESKKAKKSRSVSKFTRSEAEAFVIANAKSGSNLRDIKGLTDSTVRDLAVGMERANKHGLKLQIHSTARGGGGHHGSGQAVDTSLFGPGVNLGNDAAITANLFRNTAFTAVIDENRKAVRDKTGGSGPHSHLTTGVQPQFKDSSGRDSVIFTKGSRQHSPVAEVEHSRQAEEAKLRELAHKRAQKAVRDRAEAVRRLNVDLEASLAVAQLLGPQNEAEVRVLNELEKLSKKKITLNIDELRSLEDKSQAIVKAQDYQKAYNTVIGDSNTGVQKYEMLLKANADAIKSGAIDQQAYNKNKFKYNEAIADALDPLRQSNKQVRTEIELAKMNSREREIEIELRRRIEERRAAGLVTGADEKKQLAEELKLRRNLLEVRNIEDSILQNSVGKRREEDLGIKALSNLKNSNSITPGDVAENNNSFFDSIGVDSSFFDSQIEAQTAFYDRSQELLKTRLEKTLITQQDYASASLQLALNRNQQELDGADQFFGTLSELQRSGSKELASIGKAAAITQALIRTYQSATAAYAYLVPIVGPIGAGVGAAAAVAAGLANVAQIRSQNTGFKSGGYTGNGGTSDVAGVVHGKEFVMNAAATQRIGVDNLYAMQGGRSPQGLPESGGGRQQAAPAPNVNVPVNVVAVGTKEAALEAMKTQEGKTILLDFMEENRTELSKVFGA